MCAMFPTLESKVQKMKTVGFCKRIQGKAKKWGLLPGKSIFSLDFEGCQVGHSELDHQSKKNPKSKLVIHIPM